MTITKRTQVRAAIDRALTLDPCIDIAIAAVAASLALPAETVREVFDESEGIAA